MDESSLEGKDTARKISCRRPVYQRGGVRRDITAIGPNEGNLERGYRVPEDIAITGCNNSPDSRICEPELTTLDNKPELLGGIFAPAQGQDGRKGVGHKVPSSRAGGARFQRYFERLNKTARHCAGAWYIRRPAGVQPYNTEQGLV